MALVGAWRASMEGYMLLRVAAANLKDHLVVEEKNGAS